MAKKVGRKRTSAKKITEEQREFNNLYNKVKYHYKKMGRWEEFKTTFTKETLSKTIALGQQVNKGIAMRSITPNMLITERFRKIHEIKQQERTSKIKNALGLFYDISDRGEEITVGGNVTKVKHLNVGGVDYALQNGKLRIIQKLDKPNFSPPNIEETDDYDPFFDEDDEDFGNVEYEEEEWEYIDEDDEIGYPKEGV